LIGISDNFEYINETKREINDYLKKNEVKFRGLSKFVIADEQSKSILGLSKKTKGLYLLVNDD
jgi:hypothetical protein